MDLIERARLRRFHLSAFRGKRNLTSCSQSLPRLSAGPGLCLVASCHHRQGLPRKVTSGCLPANRSADKQTAASGSMSVLAIWHQLTLLFAEIVKRRPIKSASRHACKARCLAPLVRRVGVVVIFRNSTEIGGEPHIKRLTVGRKTRCCPGGHISPA